MKHLYLFLLPLIWAFSSCNLINPEEEIPAYIEVQQISVNTDPTIQGSNSSGISDAWIFVDGQMLGAFELPCRVPVLKNGSSEVLIGAGIKINGLSATRAPYPFYRFFEGSADFKPGETVSFSPQVSYFDSLIFPFLSNFDDLSGNRFEASGASDTLIGLTSNPAEVYEGLGSLKASLLRDSGIVEFQMVDALELPKQGTLVYLEFDYKCSHIFGVGLRSYYASSGTRTTSLINVFPTDTWKKMYINLTRAVSEQVNAENYRIFFQSVKESGSGPLNLYIDNVKIVY
jgi:hypothetical protein